jgi:hypothetical protein
MEIEGKSVQGTLINVSETGLQLKLEKMLLPVGTLQHMEIECDGIRHPALGQVVWSRMELEPTATEVTYAMGLKIVSPSAKYLELVNRIREKTGNDKRVMDPRYELRHEVRFAVNDQILTAYTENLSRGGMYLTTEMSLEKGHYFDAELILPGSDLPMKIQCEVAHRLAPDSAKIVGRQPGIGCKFVSIDAVVQNALHHYLTRVQIHQVEPDHRRDEELPEWGRLNEYLVPELLLQIVNEEKTGILHLERGEMKKLVYFKRGAPVFVESSVRSETLGQFLFRSGKLTAEQLSELAQTSYSSDVQLGEMLIERKFLDSGSLLPILIEEHEEMIINTFNWFEGEFRFENSEQFPNRISILPLRSHQTIFRGIEKWFPTDLILAWMGLNEESVLGSAKAPPTSASIPPIVLRIIRIVSTPKSLRELAAATKTEINAIYRIVFTAILSGWLELKETPAATSKQELPKNEPASIPPKPAAVPVSSPIEVFAPKEVKNQIATDHAFLSGQTFYEILSVSSATTPDELERKYKDALTRYSYPHLKELNDPECDTRVAEIQAWISLSYETIKDPHLRVIYAGQGKAQPKGKERSDRMYEERALFNGLQDLEQKKYDVAAEKLATGLRKYPTSASIRGYYAWALFMTNPQKNHDMAGKLLDRAIAFEQSEAAFYFFRGRIFEHIGDFKSAEQYYSRALRYDNNHAAAKEQLQAVREELKNRDLMKDL